MNNTPAANVPEGAAPGYEDDGSSDDSGFSASSIQNAASSILDALSHPSFLQGGTVIAPDYTPRQLDDDASDVPIQEANPTYHPYAASTALNNFIQDHTTVIAPNYTPRPLDDSVYSDIPGTPVASGQFGELEDESVRNERMKDSADYMAANWPRLYGGVVAADEGLANVVGGIQNAVGGGNGILDNVQKAEEGMQNYREQWNNEYGDSYFLNPNKFATDAGSGIGSTVPIMALSALMPGAAVAGGTRALTAALSRAGLGRLAMSKAGQALIADTVRSPISSLADSLSEYGTVVNDMMQSGMSEDEARRRAIPMFFKNMALDTFTVPLELGVMKGGKGIATGLLGRGAEEGIGKSLAKGAARTGMLAGASGLTEGYQEGAQNALENDVQGKRDGGWYNPFTWTNEDWEAARGGFVGGALMGIPGNVAAGFHPEARQAPLSAEAQEQAQGIKDTLSHGKPDGMSDTEYNAYLELANSGDPALIEQAASSLKAFQGPQGKGAQGTTGDAATEAYQDYETYDQKETIADFLDNNTVEQIGGEDNYNWLVGVLRNGTPEEVQKAYNDVIAAEKATAEQEAKNRPARSGGSVSPNTGNAMVNAVIQAANDSGVDPRLALAIAARESGGDDVNAIHMPDPHDGIYGIMQAQDETVADLGLDSQYPDWKTDPYQNAMVGMAILKSKIANEDGDVWAGVRDYNGAGEEAEQYRQLVKNNYDNMGDIGGGGNVEAPSEAFYDLSDAMNPQVDGMDPNTMAKMNLLARDFYQKYGHRLLVTSLKRNGDGSSYHDEGHAFDFSDDFLEQNPDARDWLVQQGEKYGLKGLDEFSHPVATTDGGNVHFTDHGGPVPGGTSGAVTGKITSDDGQFNRELDQAAQEAKSDMDRIQVQSDQAMNEIMNDDSAEKTAQEAQEDAENAQKQAEESQQSTQDDVVPDVAQTIRDTSNNIDEINALDGMFTKDGNGNDKFIDTPENRDFIKANYKDEITKAVNDAMSKKKAPIATPVPKAQQQTPHARLGRILSTYDRKDPKFKEYMNTFRNGTEQEQRKLADDLQTTQELERANSLKGNPLTSQQGQNTPQNAPQQGVEAPEQPEQANTPAQVKESLETQKKRNAYLSKKQKLMERVPSGRTVKVHASTSDAGFDATYKIVPAGDITASHNTDYAVNDLYPAEYQPRDRNRPQMRGQVEKMAKTMKPELLAESQFVNEGAPIVNNSGVVLNGNGRVMAIQKAYQGLTDSHKKSAKAYKDFLASIAPSLGIAPEKVQSMAHPVLVRQAADDADTKAIINSTEGGAKLGGAEQAKTDTDRLKLSTLEQFVDNGTGEFMNPSNREFRRTAAKDIFSDAEGNSVFNAKGELSPIGALRIRNAIFAKAYKDDYLLTQLSEATDNNSKNIMNAMIAAAPEVAKVNEGIKEGNLYPDYDISDVITKTAKTIMSLRNEGKPLSFHLQETNLFSQGESEAERLVLEFIERNKFKSRTIADMYKAVCDRIFAVGSPKQSKLFDSTEAPRISLENIISNAIQEVEHGQSLFDTAEEKPAEKAVSEVPDNRQAEPAGSGRVHQQEAGRVQSQEKEGNEVDEKSKQSDHVNAEPQQTESKDKESAHAEEGSQSDVQKEISKFHDLLNSKKSTPRQVVDAYKRIADAVIANAKENHSKATAGEKIITDNRDGAISGYKISDVFIKRRLQREITTVYDNAHKELRAIIKTAGKETAPKAEQPKETKPTEQPKEKAASGFTDDEIKTLTDRGFNRWTKKLPNGKVMDRLYIKPEYLGLELTRYKSGNISSAKFNGETISNSEARRIEGTKCYVDVTTKEVVCDREDLKQAIQEVIDDALKAKSQQEEQTSGVTPYKQTIDDIMDRLDHKKLTPTQAINKLKTIMKDANAARWGEFKAMEAIESKEKLSFDDYKMALDLANDAMKKVNDMRLEASRNRKARKTAKELESATKETQNDADIRFGTVEDAEKAVMKAFGIKPHKKPADTPAVPHETSTKATPKKAVKKAVIKDNDKIEKTFHLLDDSDEALEAEKKAILKELSHLSANPAFNPTLMYHLLKFGAIHVQRGLNEFARWAKAMKDTLPQSEPFLQSVWASLQAMPNHAKLDEKQLTAAIRYVGSLYDHGMTDKVDLRKSFIATLGVKNAKYFDAVYNAVMEYPSIEELKGENDNVNSNVPELVARSGEGASENAVGESRIQGGTAMRGSRQDTAPAGKGPEEPRMGHDSVPGSSTATGRTAGNRRVQTQESKDSTGSTGSTELPGSVRAGLERVPDDDQRRPAELVRVAQNRPQHEDPVNKVQEEQKDKHLNEIKKALPMLLPQQAEDVYIAEDRFKEHSGMMFTNGTGTGKTYTGLGIVKRFVDANKKNILIIAPSDGILKQWEEAATKDFGITLTRLNSTKDAGKDVVTATYANVGANRALVNRDFDLVITDESHNLMGSESAKPTDALQLVRAVTGHEDGFQRYHHDKHPEISSKLDELHEEIKKLRKRDSQNGKAYNETHDPSLADESREISNQIEKLEEERSKWHKKLETFKDADEKAFAEKQPSKVLFLSATPFQYVADLDYANGYLFNYSDYGPMDEQGYNRANGRETFYMENFGYKMRYNRLERPGSDVDTDLMEREFNRKMVESGAMHGRMLSSAYDYDRGFIRVDAGIGKKIDEGFDWLRDQPKYSELSDFLRGRFTGQQKYYLLEAIKAKQAIPLIKEYLKEGKKVVIFHNFNKGGADNPFAISREGMDHLERLDSELADHILEQYHEFQAERPDLADLDLNDLESPIETLSKAFGDELVLYNGTLSKGEREKNKNSFNNDDSKTKIILVQSAAGQAGVSLHDTTGKHQRALINLGLPTRPSEAIQQEGRIYRVGNKSNAIFRYLNTGTYMEQTAFATKLAERAGTVENIALGEMARSLKQAYVEAFEESQEGDGWKKYLPGSKTEGTGGKANDYRQEQATDFDRAKAVYFGKQKKNSRTKSQEGHDYFATPEPVGYKMVQWLQSKPGQSLLEPSAGDGAIARWMPDNTYNTVVEPSRDLTPKLMRNVAGAKVVESTFENFDLHNKFDGIAMNPPFGHGGKTAVEHVAKAYQHLKDGGRLIAIIPDGSACQKHFDKWFYGDPEAKRKADRGIADGVLMADIHLPSVTFDRAGTNVNTRMVVIDKYTDEGTRQVAEAEVRGRIDIAADDVSELFDRIEGMDMPERLDMSDEKKQTSIRKAGQQLSRSKEELKAEIKEAFPNAKEIKDEGDRMTFTMPNGSHIVVDLKNEILLTDKELAQAKKDHHIDDNGNVIVEGYAQLHGKDAYMALSQGSRENTGFHEAYHLAEGAVLTDREKSAIKKAIPDAEKRADKYAEWVEARKHGRGTAWGKLFQKINDFAAKMKKIFTGAETVNDVFRQIESGEVWERGARDNNERRYAIRQDDQEEAPVKPQDIIDAINDIVHIYEGSRLTDKERKELRESSKFDPDQKQAVRPQATDLYDRHAHAGFNRMGYFNLSNYGRILALHLDNVMNLKGNLELTNKVLDRQDKNAAENKMNGVNERLTPSQARQNAVMDFGAMMIRNPELARETYPAYAKIFDEGLEKHPDLKEKLDRVIQLNETYQGQTAAERAAGSIAREKEKVQLRKHPKEWLHTHFDKFYTNWVDDKHIFSKIVAKAEAELGRKLAYDYDVHKQAQMALNVASSRALLFLTGGKSTEDTYKVLNTVYGHAITKNVTMKDIMDALNKVSKEDVSKTGAENAYDALGNYLIAMRTEELEKHYHDAYARSAGFDEEGTREIIQNTPESIKKIAQMYWDINTNIVNILQQQGLISKDLAGKLRKYKHYCPMYRDMSDGITDMDEMIGTIGVFNKGGGYANVSNGIKRIEGGGKRPILDPITSLSQMAVSMISKCERNDVAKTFVKLGQDFSGLGDVVVRDPTLKHADPTAFAFTVWQNGEQVVYRTTPEIYDALTNNDAQANRFTIKIASGIAQTLRTGATISPSFIVRNLLRDTMSATVNSKTGFYLPLVDNVRGARKLHFDKKFSAEYHASGASMSTYMRADADSSRDLTKELLGHKYDSYPVVVKQVRQLISWAWHKYEKFGNLIEDSTRAGEFRRARNQGLSIDQAGQLAREITLDFSRHGKKGQLVNKYVPFFNATIQGTDKFIRTFKDNPMRAIMSTVIWIILPSLGLWAINHDDDWYKELDENTKYTNWAIPLPGGTHLLIPKPQEVGILFGSGIEAVLNQMTGADPHGMKEWARQYAEAMTPSLYPAVVRPLIEWMTNYSFWTGRNLVPASLQKAPSEMQFTSYTSELAKAIGDTWIAKSIKLSPIAIDNWISGWFGSAGRFVANMLNDPISYVRGNSRPSEPAKYWYEMPVIGSFIRQNGQNSEYINRMYEIQKDMNDDYERSDAGKQRKGKKSSSNKPKELKQVDTAVSSVSKLNKEIKAIRNDPKKDPDQKRREIDQRRTKINDLAKKVVLKFDK